jgi:ParB family chromosome partitioning protein
MRRLRSSVSLDPNPTSLSSGVDGIVRSGSSQSLLPYRQVPIDWIETDPGQPRQHFDPERLESLAEDLRRHKMDVPLSVRTVGPERFLLLAGERRLRAARMAELATVPIFVRDDLTPEGAELLRLRENLQREDLTPIEEARGLKFYKETFKKTWEEVGLEFGWKKSTLLEKVRLLDAPEPVRAMIEENRIRPSHYAALAALPEGDQIRIATLAASEGLSTQEVRRMKERVEQGDLLSEIFTPSPDPTRTGEGMGTRTPQPPEGSDGAGNLSESPAADLPAKGEGMGTRTPQSLAASVDGRDAPGFPEPEGEGPGTHTPQPALPPGDLEPRSPRGANSAEILFYTTPDYQRHLRYIAADLTDGSVSRLSKMVVEWFAGHIASGNAAPWLSRDAQE